MTIFKPYPEISVQAGNVEGLYRLQTVSGRVITTGYFKDEGEAVRLVSCWNAVRKIAEPENHIPATDDYVNRLEGLRKEAWARVQELEGGSAAPAPVGWNFDITAAPRGKTVTHERRVGDSTHEIRDFVPDFIWIASKCGKVIRSYWIPEAGKNPGRWSGLATGEQPIAWQPYAVPVHPNAVSDLGLNLVTKHSEVAA